MRTVAFSATGRIYQPRVQGGGALKPANATPQYACPAPLRANSSLLLWYRQADRLGVQAASNQLHRQTTTAAIARRKKLKWPAS